MLSRHNNLLERPRAGIRLNLSQALRNPTWQLFEPVPQEICERLNAEFPQFELTEYLALLLQSNGVGEVLSEGARSFIHNMLILAAEDAIQESRTTHPASALVVGRPGVDGIQYVLLPADSAVHAYYPIDNEFLRVADSICDLLVRCSTVGVRL